jgi:hypothetical protein
MYQQELCVSPVECIYVFHKILNNIDQLIVVMQTRCIFFEVRTKRNVI